MFLVDSLIRHGVEAQKPPTVNWGKRDGHEAEMRTCNPGRGLGGAISRLGVNVGKYLIDHNKKRLVSQLMRGPAAILESRVVRKSHRPRHMWFFVLKAAFRGKVLKHSLHTMRVGDVHNHEAD